MRVPARYAVALIALAVLSGLTGRASAAGNVRIAHVDLSDYPTVRLTVVSPSLGLRPPLITENGTPAAGLQAENLGSGASVVLAIDRSHSMHGLTLAHALSASRAFLALKPAGYRVSVVAFASQPLQLSQFSTSTGDADSALRSLAIDPKPGTTMYDAIVLAADALNAESSPGRVVILITDGQETTSKATLRKAIIAAHRAHVIVYPIAIRDTTYTPRPLRALAAGTGGRMFVAAPDESLVSAYGLIASQLRKTWQISYYTPVRPGASINLTAQAAGASIARASISIPASATKPASGSALPFDELTIALVALIACAFAFALLHRIRTVRASDRDLY